MRQTRSRNNHSTRSDASEPAAAAAAAAATPTAVATTSPAPSPAVDAQHDTGTSAVSEQSPESHVAATTTTPMVAASASSSSSPVVDAAESSERFGRLHHLLDQTSLFSKFLADRLPARYTAKDTAGVSSAQKATHLADRAASLAELLPSGGGLELHPFQVAGIDWLISLYENGLNGILADEMGLGKTIQCAVLLAHLRRHSVFGPFLVVAPLGTLPAWRDEFARWTPQTPVLLYHGDKDERAAMRREFISRTPDATFPVVLTNYEMALNDAKHLKTTHWKMLVVDEGHRLKDRNSRLLKTLKAMHTENRLLLTGTPLQNSLPELWSLLHFLLPDVFASLSQFQSWFDFDDQNLEAQAGQQYVINAERDHLLVTKLHSILRPFVMRRVKTDVLKRLAEKKEYTIYTPMTRLQRLYYHAVLARTVGRLAGTTQPRAVRNVLMQLRKTVNHPYLLLGDDEEARLGVDMERRAESGVKAGEEATAEDDGSDEDIPLVYVQRLIESQRTSFIAKEGDVDSKQAVSSDSEEEEDEEEDEEYKSRAAATSSSSIDATDFETIPQRNKRRKVEQATEARSTLLRSWSAPASRRPLSFDADPHRLTRVCGKLRFLAQLLPELRARGSRVLIFSQMTRVLDVLEDFLALQGAPDAFRYCRIDGDTDAASRAEQIRTFNTDDKYFAFLLSTRSGGLGLNLAAADTVILYDSDWNPHADAQAADRAHRLTQTRTVLVMRLVTPGSVEVGMAARAASKKRLEQLVLTKGRFGRRAHDEQRQTEGDGGNDEAVPNWRQQQGIVGELMELFQMQPTVHAAIRTQLDDDEEPAESSTAAAAVHSLPASESSRRTTRHHSSSSSKRKSVPASSASAPPPSSSSSTRPCVGSFDHAWLTRLLERDLPPPPDVVPRTSYEAGYSHVAHVVEKTGLLHMLTEQGDADDGGERKEETKDAL